MRIDVLGPLRVRADDREVPVGGSRLRALLAKLALDAGKVVSARALTDALWPADPPDNPGPALHSLAARLRRALPAPEVLRSEPAGYRLDLPAEAVDVIRFERLAREGRRLLRAGSRAAAVEPLTAALELWRGDPLAEVAHLPFAAAAAGWLGELRLDAMTDRIEAELACPGVDRTSAVAELEKLIAANPLRERLRALLMTALDADGRQAEALSAYETYRELLAERLGADPGPEIRELHLKVLRGRSARAGQGGNLRAALTSFVGRDAEQHSLAERIRACRLVTLVGPGGVGKTRLATVTAGGLPEPAWLVELAPLTDPADVPGAVVGAMGLRGSEDAMSRMVEALSATENLLILDGCEHLLDAAAHLVDELLGRCPPLSVLATSREPLGITGEALFPVSPLGSQPAARLFADRAQAVRPGFTPTDEVVLICRRLDGLPLAIELAAARLRSMSLDRLAAGLDDRFRILTGGSRTALARHRTLRAVVAWSWELLTGAEREAAERAATFPAAFTAEAAERIGIAGPHLYALVDKSLLVVEGGRYRMLDTLREYGRERLAETGRLHEALAEHAACFLELAEHAQPRLRGAEQIPWLTRLSAERDNLLAALRFACESGDADTAVRLGAALAMFWTVHGDHAESTRQLRAVLRMPGVADADARLRACAGYLFNAMFAGELTEAAAVAGEPPAAHGPTSAFVTAMLALANGDSAAGLAALEPHLGEDEPWTRGMLWLARSFLHGTDLRLENGRRDLATAVAGFRAAGERWGLSLALMSLASVQVTAGNPAEALGMLDEAVALAEELGTHEGQRVWLAMIRSDAGDLVGARRQLLAVLDRAASPRQVALARIPLADLARYQGDLAEAQRQLALAIAEGDPPERALYAAAAGSLAAATGDLDTAARHLAEACSLAATLPDPPMVAHVAVGIADLHQRRGEPDTAAEILGIAHALRGGPNAGNPDVARLLGELAPYRDAYRRGRAAEPVSALARLRGGLPPR
ncbi:ATP-binding protein [Amycolatopsis aidingensis]|uniref:ATP-binding protein n=1 Tax=Amycolatopsis aidingensis TaxID=2842453 RepID=UPI001C0E73D5|nr:BTAD domain-containing putative transcriptional regulator [Amycolatopsis aidingensis]